VKSMEEYQAMYRASIDDPQKFWGDMAKEFYCQTPFEDVGPVFNFDKNKGPVSIDWFKGGKTNVSHNCLTGILRRAWEERWPSTTSAMT